MENLSKLLKRFLTKEIMLYIAFGLFTTIVNLGAFYVLNSILNVEKNTANFIAIILAVLFAYVTNKDLVFHSEAKGAKEKWLEFLRFMAGRAFTMIIEFVGGLLLFQTTLPEMVSKCIVTVIVIILNFFISKFFAFKKINKK